MGNEFGTVEALWSQFENFMGRGDEAEEGKRKSGESAEQGNAGTPHEDEGESMGSQ